MAMLASDKATIHFRQRLDYFSGRIFIAFHQGARYHAGKGVTLEPDTGVDGLTGPGDARHTPNGRDVPRGLLDLRKEYAF